MTTNSAQPILNHFLGMIPISGRYANSDLVTLEYSQNIYVNTSFFVLIPQMCGKVMYCTLQKQDISQLNKQT